MAFYDIISVIQLATSIVLSLFLPALVIFVIYSGFKIARTGKIGVIDLNTAFQKNFRIVAEQNAVVNLSSELPLDSEGKVDQKEVAKRTWALVQQYHAQGIRQSQVSFWFSISAATLGFFVIIYGVFAILDSASVISTEGKALANVHRQSVAETHSILSLIAGLVIDAVAALFFIQSNKSRLLMSEFFDRLRVDRKLEESLTMISSIKDEQISSRTQALLAISLAEIKLDGSTFERILSGQSEKSGSSH